MFTDGNVMNFFILLFKYLGQKRKRIFSGWNYKALEVSKVEKKKRIAWYYKENMINIMIAKKVK